jgi:hypothetical protein
VELVDALGLPHEGHELTLSPAEQREVTLTPRLPYRAVEGVVLDNEGRPVKAAVVEIAAPGAGPLGRYPRERTDADGRFAFAGVSAAAVRLGVDAWGFAPWTSPELHLPGRGEDLEVRLTSGRSLRVTVVDEDGAPLKAQVLVDLGPYLGMPSFGHERVGAELASGTYEVEHLPEAPLDVAVQTRGSARTVPAGPRDAEIRVVFPRE